MGADRITSVHLANQDYNVCVRNNVGSCRICWAETEAVTAVGNSGSFALSNLAADGAAMAEVDANCVTDFVEIPQGVAAITDATANSPEDGVYRFCGVLLAPDQGANSATVVR